MKRIALIVAIALSWALAQIGRADDSSYTALPAARALPVSSADLLLKRLDGLTPLAQVPSFGFTSPNARAAQRLPEFKVLVQLDSAAAAAAFRTARYAPAAQIGRVISLQVGADEVASVAAMPGVRRIEMQLPHRLHLDVNTVKNGAVQARAISGLSGKGVIVGLIDSGIDWRHADFRRADGSTRVRALWDQLDDSFTTSGGTIGSPPPRDATNASVGTVYTEAQINAALNGGAAVNSVDLVGHGTFAAGCAGSNGLAAGAYTGVAPDSDFVVVRAGGMDKRDFNISGDTLAALQWIDAQAAAFGEPLVVNMSFGQHFGPHDGTSAEEVALDDFVATPGRVVAVSAGNERAAGIHTSGSARGGRALQVRVDADSDDLLAVDCWFGGTDVVDLGFFDPDATGVANANVSAGHCDQTQNASNRVSLCVDDIDAMNGSREVLFLVEPRNAGGTISIGTWQFILRDEGGVHDGHFDCWSVNTQRFSADADGSETVAIPGTARGALTVGGANLRGSWPSESGTNTTIDAGVADDLAFFSSIGPTRDGRVKPDIVTGANWVLSAWSQADGTGSGIAGDPIDTRRVSADGVHAASRGTSFSAPQVAGAAALLLESNPQLHATDVADLLHASARSDAFTGATPNSLWGYGKLDVAAAVESVPGRCLVDCDHDGMTTVDELVTAVKIALGELPLARCLAADANHDEQVTVEELTGGVRAALGGCVS
ncbi:MAG: S8 family serine peptidase [Deltaproteobacteria bacterium]|nr:S8 family serine peptidase [Deltaproteobacteria bacterium]MBI3389051.1 S8 family serine peptidase [Deltaproteobacteria bacterium]